MSKTIKLPNPACQYLGKEYDSEKEEWVIRYTRKPGIVNCVQVDTGISLPEGKVRYEREPWMPTGLIVDENPLEKIGKSEDPYAAVEEAFPGKSKPFVDYSNWLSRHEELNK